MKQKTSTTAQVSSEIKIEQWPLAKITRYPNNGRRNAATVAKLIESIKQYGWRQPIVVDPKGMIVVGDARYQAAQALGCKTVPVTVMRGVPEAKIRGYRLMDNRSHEETIWDETTLAKELVDLSAAGGDLVLTGFDDDEMRRLTGELQAPQIAEPPASVQTNVDRLKEVKAQRAKGNANVIAKSDTEHYLVVVFPDRASRESAVRRLGLPADERYIDSAAVEIKQRLGGQRELKVRADRSTAAAPANKAGATG